MSKVFHAVTWDDLNQIHHDDEYVYYLPAPGEGVDGYGIRVGKIEDGKIRYFKDASEYIAKVGIKPGTKLVTKSRARRYPKSSDLAPGSD